MSVKLVKFVRNRELDGQELHQQDQDQNQNQNRGTRVSWTSQCSSHCAHNEAMSGVVWCGVVCAAIKAGAAKAIAPTTRNALLMGAGIDAQLKAAACPDTDGVPPGQLVLPTCCMLLHLQPPGPILHATQ
jgi:hypothetical protein